jgi:hypothetical protein
MIGLLGASMPRYFFTVRADNTDTPEHAADLNDDVAALEYAFDLVRAYRAGAFGGSLVRLETRRARLFFRSPFVRRAPDSGFVQAAATEKIEIPAGALGAFPPGTGPT